MAFDTPCRSEPSRNGAKSTTLTVDLFCKLSISMVEAVSKWFGYRDCLLGSFSTSQEAPAENAERRVRRSI